MRSGAARDFYTLDRTHTKDAGTDAFGDAGPVVAVSAQLRQQRMRPLNNARRLTSFIDYGHCYLDSLNATRKIANRKHACNVAYTCLLYHKQHHSVLKKAPKAQY